MGSIGCPEMSVRNYHSTLRNIQEERRSRNQRYTQETHQAKVEWAEEGGGDYVFLTLLLLRCVGYVVGIELEEMCLNFHREIYY
jgi:hypothetical protein